MRPGDRICQNSRNMETSPERPDRRARPNERRDRDVVLALAAIVGTGAIAYANSLDAPFQFDDRMNILDNPFIRWSELSAENVRWTLANAPHLPRPVAYLSFALNHWHGGYEVTGYHAVNVAIHLANACLVFALALVAQGLLATSSQRPAPSRRRCIALAATCGLLFAVHPIQTESVTYVVQRMTSLCTFFYLSSLLLYVRARRAPSGSARWGLVAAAVACGGLALGSKEIAITLPIAILLFDLWFFRDLHLGRGGWIALVVIAAALVAGFFATGGFEHLSYDWRPFTLRERLLTQPRVVVLYLSLLALPLPSRLNLNHDVSLSHSLLDPPSTLLCLVLLLGFFALGLALAPRRRLLSFSILWLFLHLALESGVLPLELAFEHRTYLPLAGALLAVPALLDRVAAARPAPVAFAVGLVVVALTAATLARNHTWRDDVRLWADTAAKSPGLARAQTNLASALTRANRVEEAIPVFERSLALDPDYAVTRLDFALALARIERREEAEQQLREALRIAPDLGRAHYFLGEARLRDGDVDAAAEHFRNALRLDPGFAIAHLRLGLVQLNRGALDEAALHFALGLRLDPALSLARNGLGAIAELRGQPEQALAHYAEAARIDPGLDAAVQNVERMRAHLGTRAE